MMDRELVARILREEGYEEGCRELVTRYQPQLFNDCYRWTGNRRDALDLTQDAWARAFQLLDRWNPDRCCFHTWLYAIAHALLEHRRRKAARGHRAEQEHACRLLVRDEICPDPGTIAESRVLISQLLEPCTPVERSCLMLRHMDDRTAPDIARLLGVTESQVWHILSRAMAKVRRRAAELGVRATAEHWTTRPFWR